MMLLCKHNGIIGGSSYLVQLAMAEKETKEWTRASDQHKHIIQLIKLVGELSSVVLIMGRVIQPD